MTARRHQTQTFLSQRFAEVGIRPDTHKGQNFLVDLNLLDVLIREADISERDVVLEVGTGTGSLTAMLAEQAAAVVTVEVDPMLYQLAREQLAGLNNVVMLRQDALKNKNQFHPAVLAAIQEQLAAGPDRRLKLAANLPYNIATPVISNLLLTPFTPVSMTATIQKELADRIVAPPSTKDYSALSIWIQSQCDVQILRVLPPTVFWPRPKVTSAILHIVPRAELRGRIEDLEGFHQFVRSLFLHRRKFLRGVLVAALKPELGKEDVDRILADQQLGPDSRAEQLDVEQMLSLFRRVQQERAGRTRNP